jgi:hypothetical protein
LVALALLACDATGDQKGKRDPAPAVVQAVSSAPASAPASAPPRVEYVAPSVWRSTRPGVPEVAPPVAANETWRVLVNQNQPLQKKTPLWQPLSAERSVELAMPEQSAYRCLVTPLASTAHADDFGVKLEAWVLTRSLICSSDGFRSWTEHGHVLRVRPDGSREETLQANALLRERDAAGRVRETYIVVRSTPEPRAATKGAPRILPGVALAED